MKRFIPFLFLLGIIISCQSPSHDSKLEKPKYVLVIHGGAGNIPKDLPDSLANAYHAGLNEALMAGEKILANGGSALDAVQKAVEIMEINPLFNAGRGAVYNAHGKQEMDASIMDGKSLNAGAVAGVGRIKSPIQAARMVMDSSNHLMFSGHGAEVFAGSMGLEMADSAYFWSERRYKSLLKAQGKLSSMDWFWEDKKFGTVGAVALDQNGELAAATSTGGMTNKKYGRIGDSPIIGAGTYADSRFCAVSCTGRGEDFIKLGIARDLSAMMEYAGVNLHDAAHENIHIRLAKLQGSGGLIALDREGNIAMPFNTSGMFRGQVISGKERETFIH